jgi:hypothetical protein
MSRRSFMKAGFALGSVVIGQQGWREIFIRAQSQAAFWDDFSTLQSGWIGSGFTVSEGVAIITPAEGIEHAVDGGFENWNSATSLVSWTPQTEGTSSVNREETNVHDGNFAVRYDIDSTGSHGRVYQSSSMPAPMFHILRCYARASENGPRIAVTGTVLGLNDNPGRNLTTTYQEFIANGRSTKANGQIFPDVTQCAGKSAYFDDVSLKELMFSSMFSLRESSISEKVVSKATINVMLGTYAGVAACIDEPGNPQNGLIAYLNQNTIRLTEYVDGVPGDLIEPTGIAYIEGAPVEIRKTGVTVQLFYNDQQIGDDQSVSDIGNGTHHGIFSGYQGNHFNDFVLSEQLPLLKISWAGTNFTASNPGYSYTIDQYIRNNRPVYSLLTQHGAMDGHNSWSNLVRLTTDILNIAPDLLIMDMVNDLVGNHAGKALEALIRRVWSDNPDTRIIFMKAFSVTDVKDNATVNNPVQMTNGEFSELGAIAAAYGITVMDYWSAVKDLVNNQGHNLTEYVSDDNTHPTVAGYSLMTTLVQSVLPDGGTKKPTIYPNRIYDTTGDYENVPTRKRGTDYDSRTGNWIDSGTQVSSSEVDSVITYSAICQSFGCYRVENGSHDVEISIDDGAYLPMAFDQNGTEIPSGRGRHKISIKVKTGTVIIDEFWAV